MGPRDGKRELMLRASRIQLIRRSRRTLQCPGHQRVAEDDLRGWSSARLHILLPQVHQYFLAMHIWILAEYGQSTIGRSFHSCVLAVENHLVAERVPDLWRAETVSGQPAIDGVKLAGLPNRHVVLTSAGHE